MAFKHLRLTGHRGIDKIELMNLGRVNVICGKNHSGKSSILEAISRDQRDEGFTFLAEHGHELVSALDAVFKGTNVPPLGREGQRLVLENLVGATWFCGDIATHADALKVTLSTTPLGRFNLGESYSRALAKLWLPTNKVRLIPAKRRLEEQCRLSPHRDPTSDGENVLCALFHMKNKSSESAEGKTYREMSDAFFAVTQGMRFEVFSRDESLVLQFRNEARSWADARECGLGLQDIIVLLFFALADDCDVLCVEEPESHLHPEMQKRLLEFFRAKTTKQFFFSTHSNVFLAASVADRVWLAHIEGGHVAADDNTSRAKMLSELGYDVADNLVSDVVVLVEGPTDVPIVQRLLSEKGTLSRASVKMWPLGGDMMAQVDLSVLAEHKKLIALIDGDPGSANSRQQFLHACESQNIPVRQLQRYAIENYLPVTALRAVFGEKIAPDFSVKPEVKLEKQLGFSVKRRNRDIATHLALEDVANTDLAEFVDAVDALCK